MSPSLSPAVFSSSTLWATPSKEWTIAPKPKPGRKPKSDLPPLRDSNDLVSKARRIQNRTAQRAFRERKQSQLVELQARIQSYEQGEIERSAALQSVAKRLKEENDELRHENQLLREKIGRMGEQESMKSESRREVPPSPNTSSTTSANATRPTASYIPSVPSLPHSDSESSSKSMYGPTSCLPGLPDKEHDQGLSHVLDYTETRVYSETSTSSTPFNCGFCNETIPCLCNEITAQGPLEREVNFKEQTSTTIYHQPKYPTRTHVLPEETSILDDLPAYQPAVPLPRKRGTLMNSVFPVVQSPPQGLPPAICSGDPSNCLACADDTFGKAFCTAIGQSIELQSLCVDCPFRDDIGNSEDRGNPENCSPGNMTDSCTGSETMPTNEAWKKIKEHPNVSFADLNLLAEVVARRSKCTGPTVVISPALGEVTPERMASPSVGSRSHSIKGSFSHRDTQTFSGAPQNVIISCDRKGVSEVYVEGVRDALRILNKKYS